MQTAGRNRALLLKFQSPERVDRLSDCLLLRKRRNYGSFNPSSGLIVFQTGHPPAAAFDLRR